MTKVYIAHSPEEISRGTFFTTILRGEGMVVINPFEQQGVTENTGSPSTTSLTIVDQDIKDISECDVVLVLIPEVARSFGIPMEMVYAQRIYKKKVVTIVTEKLQKHPWIVYHSDYVINQENMVDVSGVVIEAIKDVTGFYLKSREQL